MKRRSPLIFQNLHLRRALSLDSRFHLPASELEQAADGSTQHGDGDWRIGVVGGADGGAEVASALSGEAHEAMHLKREQGGRRSGEAAAEEEEDEEEEAGT